MSIPDYCCNHTWADIGKPVVVPNEQIISLHRSGFNFDHGHGYSLQFQVKDIPVVEELLAKLRELKDATQAAKAEVTP